MPIEQVFLMLLAGAAGCWLLLAFRRSQRLASSNIIVTTTALSRERLEQLFVKHIANGGRDRWRAVDDHIASQPNHMGWTLELHFSESHDESGRSVMVAETRLAKVFFVPFPHKYAFWQVVERWEELAPRMRGLMKAIRRADPNADVAVVLAMFT